MKLRIVSEPDELNHRAEDVVRVIERLTGRTLLHKAEKQVEDWQVLYVPPNPDGTKKRCTNCPLWRPTAERCLIHKADEKVTADHVCGYHFYGKPYTDVPQGAEFTRPLSKELTGLEEVRGGTACESCSYYAKGHCHLLGQTVHPMACCSGWKPGGQLEKAEPAPNRQIKQTAQRFEYDVLEEAVADAKKRVEAVRKKMLKKMDQALAG